MIGIAKKIIKKIFRIKTPPTKAFLSYHYLRHNQRRQEHLASLGLDIAGSTVLEVGAGIGDHTSFFLDRGCQVVSTEARPENLKILHARYSDLEVRHLDLDCPHDTGINGLFDIVYCYGLLYHLKKPNEAIEFMAHHCRRMLLLETCVSFDGGESINLCREPVENPTQSASGQGCRPTRKWVFSHLKRHFEFVYMPITQPNHEEFPLDWTVPPREKQILIRAVFIASRRRIINELLVAEVPMQQKHAY
jgi:hypothetical protein